MRKTGIACRAAAYLLVGIWASSSAQTTVCVDNLGAANVVVSNALSLAGGLSEGSGSIAHGGSVAGGPGSIALGSAAATYFSNSFVWSDGALSPALLASGPCQFRIHATNGIYLLGGPVTGNGSGLVSLCGSNILAGTIGSAQLADASVTAAKLGSGAVGTNQAVSAEWAAWGASRFAQLAGPSLMAGPVTMIQGLTVSNGLTASQVLINGAVRQALPTESIGVEGWGRPVLPAQTNSVWIGFDALSGSSNAQCNTAVGHFALHRAQGSFNSALGERAECLVIGSFNQGIGHAANYCVTGSYNNSLGYYAGYNAHGSENVSIGHASRRSSPGTGNTAVGSSAGDAAPGQETTLIGRNAGSCATGDFNIAVGGWALYQSRGVRNTAMGFGSGCRITNGIGNVFLGERAGHADLGTPTVTNSVALGARAQVTANDTVVLGNTNQTVVIGGTSPSGANFVVTPGGDLVAKGAVLLRYVVPQGDLGMGGFTNCPAQ